MKYLPANLVLIQQGYAPVIGMSAATGDLVRGFRGGIDGRVWKRP